MNLMTKLDHFMLDNPLMPASGPLTGDLPKLLFIRDQSVGAMVTKTISRTGAVVPRPCIYGDRYTIMNSELWSEFPMEKWLTEILPAYDKKDKPLIISAGYTKEDMDCLIPLLDPYADAFEISTHYVGKELSVIKETVRTIRKHTEKPIYMKISPHMPDIVGFAQAVREAGASGIVAINSLGPSMRIDAKNRTILYGNEKGFVWTSGPTIKPIALAVVYTIKQAIPDFTVIGTGGITSAEDVIEFLLAGADAVQLLSGALLKGKTLYSQIIEDLPKTLSELGFTSIEEVKQQTLINKTVYEPMLPHLIEENCIQCRICEKICPYFAIHMEDRIQVDEDRCFGCGLCVSKCPTKALEFKERQQS